MTDQQSHVEKADVWDQLRQRIDQMQRDDRGKVNPQALAKKLADRAKVLRGRIGKGEPAGPQVSFLAFCHGAQRFGVLVSDIVEIQPINDYTPVPGAPPFITGVIHWRGAIISLIDLVKLFGIAESGLIDERACMVLEAGGHRVGILAGDVEDLCSVPLDKAKPAPELPADIAPEWVVGVYDENRLILKIDEILQDERLLAWKA